MTRKEILIRTMSKRGYEIEDCGKMVIFRMNTYSAIWFFNADGSQNESNPPIWNVR